MALGDKISIGLVILGVGMITLGLIGKIILFIVGLITGVNYG